MPLTGRIEDLEKTLQKNLEGLHEHSGFYENY